MMQDNKSLHIALFALLGSLSVAPISAGQSSNPAAGQASRVSEDSIQSVILVDRLPACAAANKFVTCSDWTPNAAVDQGAVIAPSNGNPGGYQFRATKAGTSASSQPSTWPQTTETTINDGTVTWENIGETIHRHRIEIQFSTATKGLVSDLDPANVQITTLPSGTLVALPERGTFVPLWNNQMVQFDLSRDARTPPGDTSVKVCFSTFSFASHVVTNLCATGKVYNDANIADLVSDTLNAITKAVSSPKTTPEKNFFGGFNVTAPSGGGSTQGSADISFNHTFWNHPLTDASLFDQAIVNFQLNKGSTINADPRHFSGSVTARKTFLVGIRRDELQTITAAALSATPNQVLNQDAVNALTRVQKRYLRSIYLDNAFSYEGDVSGSSIGNISNVLYDGKLYINSAALPVVGKSGFINFQILPAGVEAGYNVSTRAATGTSASPNNYSISRLVNGAIFSLLYQPQDKPDSSPNVSLDLGIVNRYLFLKELYYNQQTKQTTFTNSGDRYYAEANVKVLLGAIGPGRPGIQVGFQRGWLPPSYAFTKMFTVSLIYQTADDNTSKNIKLVNKQ